MVHCPGIFRAVCAASCFSLALVCFLVWMKGYFQNPRIAFLLMIFSCFGTLVLLAAGGLLSPSRSVAISAKNRTIGMMTSYFGLFNRRSVLDHAEITSAGIHAMDVVNGRGQSLQFFCPVITLRTGEFVWPCGSQGLDQPIAELIAAEVASVMPLPMSPHPTSVSQGTPVVHHQVGPAGTKGVGRSVGLVIIVGGIFLLWTMRAEFFARREANILESNLSCMVTWTLSKNDVETKQTDCITPVSPDRATATSRVHITRGQSMRVALRNADGALVEGQIFLRDPQALTAKDKGKTVVVYDDRVGTPIRAPFEPRLLAIAVSIPILGLIFFFIHEIRSYLLMRGMLKR